MRQVLILALLCPLLSLAQLTVGDKLPPLQLTPMVNCNYDTLNTASLKGKFTLLEFWATWCSSCLKKLPLLDSFQRIHAVDLQIILVGRKSSIDNRQRVVEFFQKRKTPSGENYILPALVGDTVLNNLFPHQEIPYAVLLDREQKVLAFLTYDQLTPQYLENLLGTQRLDALLPRCLAALPLPRCLLPSLCLYASLPFHSKNIHQ